MRDRPGLKFFAEAAGDFGGAARPIGQRRGGLDAEAERFGFALAFGRDADDEVHAFAGEQREFPDGFAVRGLFDATEAAFGGVDVLINNAGIMKLGKVADCDDAMFDLQIAVNLKGSFNGMREAARRLRDGGRIVNLSTSVVGTKLETYSVYAATKAAVETMTAILSKEMRGRNITVNAVAPGPTATTTPEISRPGKSLAPGGGG